MTGGAVIVRKEKKIVAAMRDMGATSASHTVTMESIDIPKRLPFILLKRHGVLREASPERFYLDEPAWDALVARRRRMALVMIALAVIAGVIAWATTISAP